MGAVLRLPTSVSPLLEDAIGQFVADQQLRGLSPHTVTFYRVTLGPFARYAVGVGCEATDSVTAATLRAFLAEKSAHVGARRLNHYRDAVRVFYDWAIAEGYAGANPAARLGKVREARRIIPTFTEAEVETLLRQPNTGTFIGLRDQVFMLLLLDTGIRLAEAAELQLGDLDFETLTLKVMGKGSKERLVGFSPFLAHHLNSYLTRRASALKSVGLPECPWLFLNQFGARCTRRAFQSQVKVYGARVGLTRVRVSPHTFRHTFAVFFVRHGGSPFHLQRILGHTDLAMSRRYCELADVDFLTKQRELSPLATLNLGTKGQPRLGRAAAVRQGAGCPSRRGG
jgi:site-specific recombinase XerD